MVQQSYQRDNLSELARELGLQPKSIYRWRNAYVDNSKKAFPGNGNRTPLSEQGECERLKAENAELRMERDILKKAIGIPTAVRTTQFMADHAHVFTITKISQVVAVSRSGYYKLGQSDAIPA